MTIYEKIKSEVNISDYISRYLNLIKKGNSFVSLCPFHSDSNPSMNISDKKGIFKCFVCGVGGDIFAFEANYQKCSYKQAIMNVARNLNYPLDGYTIKEDKNQFYFKIMDKANLYLQYQLSQNDEAKSYLLERKITKEIIDNFKLGYDDGNLFQHLLKQNIDLATLGELGLVEYGSNNFYDSFNRRITFPICDEEGKIIAYSARIIDSQTNLAKYYNSKQTPIYNKSNILFNYHVAKRTRDENVYLVEGIMDVIGFYRQGVISAVASLGTNITLTQIEKLITLKKNIVIAYDGDSAGLKASLKLLKLLIAKNMFPDIIYSNNGKDPDELSLNNELFKQYLNSQKKAIDFFLEYFYYHFVQVNNNYPQYKKEVEDLISNIADFQTRKYYLSKLHTSVSNKNAHKSNSHLNHKKDNDIQRKNRINLFALLLNHPLYYTRIEELNYFSDDQELQDLFTRISFDGMNIIFNDSDLSVEQLKLYNSILMRAEQVDIKNSNIEEYILRVQKLRMKENKDRLTKIKVSSSDEMSAILENLIKSNKKITIIDTDIYRKGKN